MISEYIYNRLEKATEGELSRVRASLVKEDTLAIVAREIDLGDFLLLGGGEMKSGGYRRASILSDALEALFGAVYLEAGFEQCQKTILFLYDKHLDLNPSAGSIKDPKTTLQEFLQSKKLALPVYRITHTEGKSHNQTFTVECQVTALNILSSGQGSSRKKAEQMAAFKVLEKVQATG